MHVPGLSGGRRSTQWSRSQRDDERAGSSRPVLAAASAARGGDEDRSRRRGRDRRATVASGDGSGTVRGRGVQASSSVVDGSLAYIAARRDQRLFLWDFVIRQNDRRNYRLT